MNLYSMHRVVCKVHQTGNGIECLVNTTGVAGGKRLEGAKKRLGERRGHVWMEEKTEIREYKGRDIGSREKDEANGRWKIRDTF